MKKRLISLALAGVLLVSLTLPSLAADQDWQGAYTTAITKNTDKWGCVIQLVDLDLDGTPELLIGGLPGSGLFSEITYAATYKNGTLTELTYEDGTCLSTGSNLVSGGGYYDLYRNSSTGKVKFEGGTILRSGAGYYAKVTSSYALSGTTLVCKSLFAEDVSGSVTTYFKDGKTVTASQYQAGVKSRNSGWTKVGSYSAQISVSYKKPTSSNIQNLFSQYSDGPILASASTHNIQVDGKAVSLTAYSIGGNNYFKLRDVASLLSGTGSQFQVGWDSAARLITLTTGQSYTAVGGELQKSDSIARLGTTTKTSITLDGAAQSFTSYNIDGNNYFMLRDLGKALGFNVTWDNATRTVSIQSGVPYTG